MNVFKRFSDIVSSNINSALDKMEDPKKMIALMIDQMEETAIDLRASIAEKSAALATLERQCAETGDSIARWSGRARLALEKGREDLAREAIAEKKALESHLATLEGNTDTLRSIVASPLREAEGSDFARRFEELQARIERWEAEAKACSPASTSKSTRQTFEDMEKDKAIDDELAALKASMNREEQV